jgi:hypothetical protein
MFYEQSYTMYADDTSNTDSGKQFPGGGPSPEDDADDKKEEPAQKDS